MLRRVGIASTIFAFALVVWGAVVRINGAGMTCPDWPKCRGAWFPALDPKVVYEYYHRVGAAALTVIVIGTFAAAWLARNDVPSAYRAAWVSLGLIVAQVAAGAVTIFLNNNPPSVAIHLVLGFSTFVSLLIVTLAAYIEPVAQARPLHLPAHGEPVAQARPLHLPAYGGPVAQARPLHLAAHGEPVAQARPLQWIALVSTLLAFAAVFAGGWMAASNDGLACTAIPLCGATGTLTPDQQLHMGHRFAAYATIIAVAVTWLAAIKIARGIPPVLVAAWTAFGLVLVQGLLGAAAVTTRLQPVIRSWHEANAALLIAALVATTYLAFRYSASSG
jgi:heme A synthase